jgi:AhpD family alkylhydroperoxidase
MKTIQVPVKEQVSPEAQILFDQIKKGLGKVPNLYATIGYSATALKAILEFEGMLNKGAFTPKEREAIALVVSEVNGCNYCLAAHTMAAFKRGYTQQETLEIRKGQAGDSKLQIVIQLAQSIVENIGTPAADLLDRFFQVGYNEAALMELIGLITVRIFTNYVYAMTNIPVDFPVAEPLSYILQE